MELEEEKAAAGANDDTNVDLNFNTATVGPLHKGRSSSGSKFWLCFKKTFSTLSGPVIISCASFKSEKVRSTKVSF